MDTLNDSTWTSSDAAAVSSSHDMLLCAEHWSSGESTESNVNEMKHKKSSSRRGGREVSQERRQSILLRLGTSFFVVSKFFPSIFRLHEDVKCGYMCSMILEKVENLFSTHSTERGVKRASARVHAKRASKKRTETRQYSSRLLFKYLQKVQEALDERNNEWAARWTSEKWKNGWNESSRVVELAEVCWTISWSTALRAQ